MKAIWTTGVALVCLMFGAQNLLGDIVNENLWINEFHYDNVGGDVGEFVEVAAPVGFDVSTLLLEYYNGAGGATYATDAGSNWTVGLTVDGYTFYTSNVVGIQNGAPDGIGLSSADGLVLYQFLSYEGTLLAANGNWNGSTSTDVGVSEGSATAIGDSLQLTGTGSEYSDFSWTGPIANTAANINTGQTIVTIPEPATAVAGFVVLALGMTSLRRRTA